jgi:hypothetical protein
LQTLIDAPAASPLKREKVVVAVRDYNSIKKSGSKKTLSSSPQNQQTIQALTVEQWPVTMSVKKALEILENVPENEIMQEAPSEPSAGKKFIIKSSVADASIWSKDGVTWADSGISQSQVNGKTGVKMKFVSKSLLKEVFFTIENPLLVLVNYMAYDTEPRTATKQPVSIMREPTEPPKDGEEEATAVAKEENDPPASERVIILTEVSGYLLFFFTLSNKILNKQQFPFSHRVVMMIWIHLCMERQTVQHQCGKFTTYSKQWTLTGQSKCLHFSQILVLFWCTSLIVRSI